LSQDLAKVGKHIEDIPVELSYRIIDLFSGHLYSSPTKAIEELVVNSYDAFAADCVVSVPEKQEQPVWIWDNGDSMDIEGLKELWLVAKTMKRDQERERAAIQRGRPPIGKFGIGKLASYVLGRRITHVCRRASAFLAVTMDYSKITDEPRQHLLSVRKLTESDVKEAIPFVVDYKYDGSEVDLFGKGSKSWTVVVVDQLKQLLPVGRLGWVLSTGLPLAPDFRLFLNGSEVKSAKERIKKLGSWQIGKDDEAARQHGFDTGQNLREGEPFNYYVVIKPFGKISGTVDLFYDPLDTGKASEVGHSNGFFVMARKRLINAKDNYFGITTLPHLGFNRFRAVVHADFLDTYLTASREDTTNIDAKEALKKYLIAKFNEVRNYYESYIEKEGKKETLEDHLKSLPGTLLTYPLRQAIDRIAANAGSSYSIRLAPDKPRVASIQKIETRRFDPGGPLATLEEGCVFVNVNHPFYNAFVDFPGIRKLVVAEILLEAYLLDAGVEMEKSTEVLTRRDQLLRMLASEFPEGAIEVSTFIRNSVASDVDLEMGCTDGFRVLGFDVTALGGRGKPDGLATAHLGLSPEGKKRKYLLTFDAKSSQDEAVQSGNLGLATVARHRKEYGADYAVVIAPDYQVSEGEASKAVKEAREQKVCLIRANDFADLIAASAVKPLSLEKIRELFEKCSPEETTAWVQAFKQERPTAPPIRAIIETVWKMQTEDERDAPQIGAIKYAEPGLKKFSNEDIRQWLISLSRLQPDLVVIAGDKVQLNQTPENVTKQCISTLNKAPQEISRESMLEALRDKHL
jgi:hypothetical protein